MMQIDWKENEDGSEAMASVGELEVRISLYTEDFKCKGMWHWHVWIRDTPRAAVSGIARTKEEGTEQAVDWVGKGADAIRAAAVQELRDQVYVAMMVMSEIDDVAPFEFPAFEAGYNAGLAAARGALDGLWTAQFGHEADDTADAVVTKH